MRLSGRSNGDDRVDQSLYRAWDEKRVITWLHSIKCGQYEPIFKGMIGPPSDTEMELILYSQQFHGGQPTRMRPKNPTGNGHQESWGPRAHLRCHKAAPYQDRPDLPGKEHGEINSLFYYEALADVDGRAHWLH